MPERAAIRARLGEFWNFPRFGLPVKRGGRLFYTKNDGLQNQASSASSTPRGRRRGCSSTPIPFQADGTVAVTGLSPSDGGTRLAYGLAAAGSDWTELHVRDVATGADLDDVVRWVKFSGPRLDPGRRRLLLLPLPRGGRKGDKLFGKLSGRQLCYHRLGDRSSRPTGSSSRSGSTRTGSSTARVSDDGRYLVITVEQNDRTQNALYYIDLVDPLGTACRRAGGAAPRPV